MKKLILAASILLIGCTKDNSITPDYPIKFQSTVYSNGYAIKTKTNPINLILDFVALPSLAQGSDKDWYQITIGDENLQTTYITFDVAVSATQAREASCKQSVYGSWCNSAPFIYYQIKRREDGKTSEIRKLGTKW